MSIKNNLVNEVESFFRDNVIETGFLFDKQDIRYMEEYDLVEMTLFYNSFDFIFYVGFVDNTIKISNYINKYHENPLFGGHELNNENILSLFIIELFQVDS